MGPKSQVSSKLISKLAKVQKLLSAVKIMMRCVLGVLGFVVLIFLVIH